MNDLTNILPLLEGLNKEQELFLLFDDTERKIKTKKHVSGYLVDEVTKIFNSRKASPFLKWKDKLIKSTGKEEVTWEELETLVNQDSGRLYEWQDIENWRVLGDKWIDPFVVKEEDRINIEVFKLVIDSNKDFDNIAFTTKEQELIKSAWDSEYWKNQDRKGIRLTVNSFRSQNKL